MKMTSHNVKKIIISDIENLDPISLYIEDYGKGRGEIIITCYDKSWKNYWGAMGERNLIEFILSADNNYLFHKFNPNMPTDIDNMDELENDAKKNIIGLRKESIIDKELARNLYDDCNMLLEYKDCDSSRYAEMMYEIYGSEWYDCIPKQTSSEYTYFCRILDTVKEALKGPMQNE